MKDLYRQNLRGSNAEYTIDVLYQQLPSHNYSDSIYATISYIEIAPMMEEKHKYGKLKSYSIYFKK
jgi:hypothetical protein